MPKPTPEAVDPAQLPQLARDVMAGCPFPMLATLDGDQPCVRPVSPVRTDGLTAYIANLRFYAKTAQIAANPRVELCYMDGHHNQLRITGIAHIVTDRHALQHIWDSNALMRQYLVSIDNPQLIVYRIDPSRVRYMREWAMDYHDVPID